VSAYESDSRDWDIAVITLAQPVGLYTGWMGIKSLPPAGLCSDAPFVLPGMEVVGYPVNAAGAHTQMASFCDLKVRRLCAQPAAASAIHSELMPPLPRPPGGQRVLSRGLAAHVRHEHGQQRQPDVRCERARSH